MLDNQPSRPASRVDTLRHRCLWARACVSYPRDVSTRWEVSSARTIDNWSCGRLNPSWFLRPRISWYRGKQDRFPINVLAVCHTEHCTEYRTEYRTEYSTRQREKNLIILSYYVRSISQRACCAQVACFTNRTNLVLVACVLCAHCHITRSNTRNGTHSIFSVSAILLVTRTVYSQCLPSYWSHAQYILSVYLPFGHTHSIFSVSAILFVCSLSGLWGQGEKAERAWRSSLCVSCNFPYTVMLPKALYNNNKKQSRYRVYLVPRVVRVLRLDYDPSSRLGSFCSHCCAPAGAPVATHSKG
jgi:hypothetical protein